MLKYDEKRRNTPHAVENMKAMIFRRTWLDDGCHNDAKAIASTFNFGSEANLVAPFVLAAGIHISKIVCIRPPG